MGLVSTRVTPMQIFKRCHIVTMYVAPHTNSVFAVRSNASNQSGLPITNNVVQFIYNFSLPGIVIATRNCDLCNDHCPQHCRRTFGIFCFDQHPAPLVVAIDMMVVQSKRDLVCVRQRTKPMIKQVLEVQRAQINVRCRYERRRTSQPAQPPH